MLGEENILFMLVFVIGGIIFGALIMYLIMDARRSPQDAGEHKPTQPLSTPLPQEKQDPVIITGTDSVKPVPEDVGSDVERKKLIGFWRDMKSGRLMVQMEDQWFNNTQQMDEPLRLRYERTLREASQWLDLLLTKQGVEKKTENLSTEANVQPVVLDEPPKRKLTIVEQVDEILQELLGNSHLRDQNIRLSEIYNKGVVVWVGREYYEGIDAVPDDEVKQFIKTAVKQWEVINSKR